MFGIGGLNREDEFELDLLFLGGIEQPGAVQPVAIDAGAIIILTAPLPTLAIVAEYGYFADITLVAPLPTLVVIAESFAPKKTIAGRRYYCTITGAADGLPDLVVPISSINGTLRYDGLSSYLVVVPDGISYAADIAARANGGFIIDSEEIYTDGTSEITQSVEFNIESQRPDSGGRNFSVSIRGTSSVSNPTPKKLNVYGISFNSLDNSGKRRVRCEPNKDFLQGDTAVLPSGAEFAVELVTHIISATNQIMELKEL